MSEDREFENLHNTSTALHARLVKVTAAMASVLNAYRECVSRMRDVCHELSGLAHDSTTPTHSTLKLVIDRVHMSIEEVSANDLPTSQSAWQEECLQRLNGLVSSLSSLKPHREDRKKKLYNLQVAQIALSDKEKSLARKGKRAEDSKVLPALQQTLYKSQHEFRTADATYKSVASEAVESKDVTCAAVTQSYLYNVCKMHSRLATLHAQLYEMTTLHQGVIH